MKALVTGCAGFIGSTLCDALLEDGHEVVGVDCFTPYYPRAAKEAAVTTAGQHASFTFVEGDLREMDLVPLLDGVEVVFHQAAQPGVRLSWAAGFPEYDSHNVLATQRLLEAATATQVDRFVYASSSSVYGQTTAYPTGEEELPAPHSPYGVTKLAGEHLCGLYAANWGLPTVILRYFTVYGPRQRPDMAIYRLVDGALRGEPFPVYGDGTSLRDYTYVDDVVAANVAAATADLSPGALMNIAGGSEISLAGLLELVGEVIGRPVEVTQHPAQAGDVRRTAGRIDRARLLLGYEPATALRDGIARQAAWQQTILA